MEDLTSVEASQHMERWAKYMGDLGERNLLIAGMPLQQTGVILSRDGGKEGTITSQNGDVVGGWLHIKANDYNHAVELTKPCPIFEHNGNIEIREIMPMDM